MNGSNFKDWHEVYRLGIRSRVWIVNIDHPIKYWVRTDWMVKNKTSNIIG